MKILSDDFECAWCHSEMHLHDVELSPVYGHVISVHRCIKCNRRKRTMSKIVNETIVVRREVWRQRNRKEM